MQPKLSDRPVAARRGFTLIEFLVAMALVVTAMDVASHRFVAGIEAVRHLKGIGDLNERLRDAAIGLRRDVLDANDFAKDFILDALRSGSGDAAEAEDLRLKYEVICADAIDLEARLRLVERQTENPVARRLLRRALKELDIIKEGAAEMVALLELIEEFADEE